MTIIVGLGNPGEKFNNTRHNAGSMAVDFFAKKNNFPEFKLSKKYHSLISEKDDITLVKPETFMNESGKAVQAMLKNKEATLLVIQDDIDMPLGKIKFTQKSSAGGHKGIESIIQHLGNNDFARLKIGIATGDQRAEEVVLKKFSQEEIESLHIEKVAEALDMFVKEGLEKAKDLLRNKN